MKYKNLPTDNYKENRKKFLSKLNSHSIAIFNSKEYAIVTPNRAE